MTTFGLVMMVSSYSIVLTLVTFCFYRVMTTPGSTEHQHAPIDIDTQDTDE